ncbi:MAG: penicillin-binding protein 2 [Candidatus Marinimicrobia bacterium]|nr:penicillin-binding protein 2 [Candidatus Neomarinimicrobiota bacterium]
MNSLYCKYRNRIGAVTIVLLFLFIVLSGRLIYVQIFMHEEYAELAKSLYKREKNINGSRGVIFDRNGIPLTKNLTHHSLWVDTEETIDCKEISQFLSDIFDKPARSYFQKLQKSSRYLVLEKNVLDPQIAGITQRLKDLNIHMESHSKRYYPYSDLAAQVIGYTDTDEQGSIGVECQYNSVLSGNQAVQDMVRNSRGQLSTDIYEDRPVISNGLDITLTLDITYQAILQDELQQACISTNAKGANGLIINPFTGEILAMATYPSFDPNNYSSFPAETYLNQVISMVYEPGSTFKIVTISAGLENNLISPWQTYDCENGEYHLFNRTFHDHEKYEILTVSEILMHSSNIGMVKIATDIGSEFVFKYSTQFGFGEPTGIQLPHENGGILRGYQEWTRSSGPTIAMGQELAVTTLQTAMSYCAISNGGYLIMPTIIRKITGNNQVPDYRFYPQPIRRVIAKDTADDIMTMLRGVILEGTADKARLPGFPIAGKTSTAQKYTENGYSKSEFISAFAGVFPIDNPEFVCVVAVDSPKYGYHWGNETAVPVVRKVFERIIGFSDRDYIRTLDLPTVEDTKLQIQHLSLQSDSIERSGG